MRKLIVNPFKFNYDFLSFKNYIGRNQKNFREKEKKLQKF